VDKDKVKRTFARSGSARQGDPDGEEEEEDDAEDDFGGEKELQSPEEDPEAEKEF
jgi:hypothetical protein